MALSETSAPVALQRSNSPTSHGGIVVFSGGSAANNLVDIFEQLRNQNSCTLSYVIPISDNGGSSSEIIRVFGGPGIGDVRSRLVRLIPQNDDPETTATRCFFNHRLPKIYKYAREEWLEIIEGTHSLWDNISSPKKELIRSYLNLFNLEAIKRGRPSSRFDYSGASIGNIFLTGTRLFTGSFEAAIYQLATLCGVPPRITTLPALNTNFAHHIAARLTNGHVITGQNDISHPSESTAAVPTQDLIEDANLPGSLPALRKGAIIVSKNKEADLPARIRRLFYINPYGEEIRLTANPRVIEALSKSSTVIYSIGSLWTSIIPSLILRGVGAAIAGSCAFACSSQVRTKILILNGTIDRETGPSADALTALDFVAAIAGACAESQGLLMENLEESMYVRYVTHVIYLDSPTAPRMDKAKFARLGIEVIRSYGPTSETGKTRYDDRGLLQSLEAIVGRQNAIRDRSRRNTLIG